jgi:hypothetical protein
VGNCENYNRSLSDGDLTLPWEDRDNAYGYVTCQGGHETDVYGYGEDD